MPQGVIQMLHVPNRALLQDTIRKFVTGVKMFG